MKDKRRFKAWIKGKKNWLEINGQKDRKEIKEINKLYD